MMLDCTIHTKINHFAIDLRMQRLAFYEDYRDDSRRSYGNGNGSSLRQSESASLSTTEVADAESTAFSGAGSRASGSRVFEKKPRLTHCESNKHLSFDVILIQNG